MAKAADEHTTHWSVDAADEYLRRNVGLQDDLAIYELNEKLAQGRLPMHWRRTDNAGAGETGIVPAMSWQSGLLAVTRDRNQNAVNWATGKLATANDGRAFVQTFQPEPWIDPEKRIPRTYELTVPERIVRMLRWSVPDEVLPKNPRGAGRRTFKHDWTAIHGEIARRCHDDSGRIRVPKNVAKFAADMLQWCVNTGRREPVESEMRTAVKEIFEALRREPT
jgi:hypothetical protein